MGTLVATGLCCCFSCCCKECGEGCQKWLGPQKVTKLYYFLLVLVFVIPAIFVFFFLNQWTSFLNYFGQWISCPSTSGEQFGCIGQSVIFRLSLCLLALFGLMFIIMLCRSRLAMVINEGCFCFKYLLIVGLFIGSLWLSNEAFLNFAVASQYISIPFMILQCVILIDLFYLAGIKLVKHYDEGESRFACYLVTLTIIAQACAIALNVLGYLIPTFIPLPDTCSGTLWVNIITSILLVILPIIQFLHLNDQNSLLTTALVSLYISFLAFICQFSFEQGDQCNRMDIGPLVTDVVLSLFFFILTMYGSIMGGTGQVKVTRDGNLNNAMGLGNNDPNKPEQEENKAYKVPENNPTSMEHIEQGNEEKYTSGWGWVKWHFYMCLAVIYVGMLITNWNSASIVTGELSPSGFGFWVRLIICWVSFLLYVWTMIAPRVCPSRDFHVE